MSFKGRWGCGGGSVSSPLYSTSLGLISWNFWSCILRQCSSYGTNHGVNDLLTMILSTSRLIVLWQRTNGARLGRKAIRHRPANNWSRVCRRNCSFFRYRRKYILTPLLQRVSSPYLGTGRRRYGGSVDTRSVTDKAQSSGVMCR